MFVKAGIPVPETKKYIYETPKNCGFIQPKYVDNGDKTPTELVLTLRRRIKSHLLFAGIIRSSPFSPR